MRSYRAAGGAVLLLAACLAAAGCDQLMPQRTPGEALWRKRCAECHGLDGAGNTPRYMGNPSADLIDDNWRHGGEEGSWEVVIREGVFGQMPANEDLTPEQVRDLVRHLKELRRLGTGTRG